MLSTTSCLFAVMFASVAPSLGAPASLEATSQASVRWKLNRIETAKNLERYENLVQREMNLRDDVKAYIKSSNNPDLLHACEESLKQVQENLETTKIRLVDLEVEKAKLIDQFGKPESGDAATENIDRLNRSLEKILERLTTIEKRLEKK
jgi:hypothetical protein